MKAAGAPEEGFAALAPARLREGTDSEVLESSRASQDEAPKPKP